MLYFVSVSGIDAGYPLDDYEDFIVEAENEENLAAAIVANRLDGMESNELDGSVWRVSNYKGGILFDDESGNVHAWQRDTSSGKAVRIKDETTLLDALESLIIQELE